MTRSTTILDDIANLRKYVYNLERWLFITMLLAVAAFFGLGAFTFSVDRRLDRLEAAKTETVEEVP